MDSPAAPPERQTYSAEECLLVHESMQTRILELERNVSDHNQRFDTLQTPWPKRVWFLLQGWPWYDLNGTRKPRPWDRNR